MGHLVDIMEVSLDGRIPDCVILRKVLVWNCSVVFGIIFMKEGKQLLIRR
jgi:hypothetical protein